MNQVRETFHGIHAGGRTVNRQGGGGRGLCRGANAFTLIEMLTVIAVIGLLAGMGVGLAPRVARANRESRIRAQLNQIATAIESYHADFGYYPPDNVDVSQNPPLLNPVTNKLFYELSGVVINNQAGNPYFQARGRSEQILPAKVRQFFNTDGFENAKPSEKELRKPYLNLTPKQHDLIHTGPDIEVLVVPVPWPAKRADKPIPGSPSTVVNPWRYVSTQPTNNATSFDLWAEWVEGDKVKILSNWARDVQDRN
jgi:prepilin-type N-terminal cleavage/methylation domain-containing protein